MPAARDSTAAKLRLAGAVVLLACVWLAMLLLGRGPLDRIIEEALYAGGRPAFVRIALFFTLLGQPALLIAAALGVAAWVWLSGRRRFALGLLLVILVGRMLADMQKYWIARARPTVEPHLVIVESWSFPSGHAASSMIFYLTLALALAPERKRRMAALAAIMLSLLIGISRIMLGVHWPSDVIGGWSFGLLWVLVTLRPAERLFGGDSRSTPKPL